VAGVLGVLVFVPALCRRGRHVRQSADIAPASSHRRWGPGGEPAAGRLSEDDHECEELQRVGARLALLDDDLASWHDGHCRSWAAAGTPGEDETPAVCCLHSQPV